MSTQARGATRVLVLSTTAFTLMFAVWLMFGILGVPIQKEFGLTDVQLSWVSAVAVLNGSLWRLPAGMLTDRVGGRVVTIAMLFLTAIPAFFLTRVGSYGALLVLAFLVGFAGPRCRGRQAGRGDARPLEACAGLALQPLLSRSLRRVCRPGRLAAEVLRREFRHPPARGGAAHRHLHLPRLAASSGRSGDAGKRPDHASIRQEEDRK